MTFSHSLFQSDTHTHHFSEVYRSTGNHLLIIKRTKSLQKNLSHLFFFHRRNHLGGNLTPSLSIFLEGFFLFLHHSSQLIPIRSHVHIVLVLLHKRFSQVIESADMGAIKAHIPLRSRSSQTVLEIVNQQALIISVSGHLPYIHHQMCLRTRISFILLKFKQLELSRYFHIGNKAKIMHILSKQFFPTQSFHFFLQFFKLILETIHSVMNLTWSSIINGLWDKRTSMNNRRGVDHNRSQRTSHLRNRQITFRHAPGVSIRHTLLSSTNRNSRNGCSSNLRNHSGLTLSLGIGRRNLILILILSSHQCLN